MKIPEYELENAVLLSALQLEEVREWAGMEPLEHDGWGGRPCESLGR